MNPVCGVVSQAFSFGEKEKRMKALSFILLVIGCIVGVVAPTLAQTNNGTSCDSSIFGSMGQNCSITGPTTHNRGGDNVKVYAPPGLAVAGNSTALCIRQWSLSISAVMAGIGVGIPEPDAWCRRMIEREFALKLDAERRANVELALRACASRALLPKQRMALCVAVHAALVALIASPSAPKAEKGLEPRVAKHTERSTGAPHQVAQRDQALMR